MAAKRESVWSTWVKAMVRPSALYPRDDDGDDARKMPAEPHFFAVAIGFLGALASGVVEALLAGKADLIAVAFVGAVGGGVLSLGYVYLTAALTHFWLVVVRGKRGAFRDTVAVTCYARAPLLFTFVPFAGIAFGSLWNLVLTVIGLERAHRTTLGRALFAAIVGSPILFALFLRAGVVEAFKTPSGSMMPSLMIGDHLFVSKLAYGPLIPWTDARLFSRLPPARGDVMVFKFPENKDQDFIKRAIALPGDTLEAINGRPVINGWLVPHCRVGPFSYENRSAELFVEFLGERSYLTLFDADPDASSCRGDACAEADQVCRAGVCGVLQGPFPVVARDEVWVMGDNRNNSHDSRTWAGGKGAGVPFENIKGRGTIVWMSLGRGGEIVKDRLFLGLHGAPTLPGASPAIQEGIARCLRERPAQTAPPAAAPPR